MSEMKKNYFIAKDQYDNCSIKIDCQKLKGYRLIPKNNIEYDGIMVNQLVIINQSFIEKVLKKKIKRKLDMYLNLIIRSLNEEPDDDGTIFKTALDDLSRYRNIVEFKYQKFLDEKYIELLLQKIALLEHELKQKLIYMSNYSIVEEKSKTGRSR